MKLQLKILVKANLLLAGGVVVPELDHLGPVHHELLHLVHESAAHWPHVEGLRNAAVTAVLLPPARTSFTASSAATQAALR